jgi:membrane associated rhomboid family serine protease
MTLNPLPFLFLPGTALLGYLIGGGYGCLLGIAAWGAVVGLGTAILCMRIRRETMKRGRGLGSHVERRRVGLR